MEGFQGVLPQCFGKLLGNLPIAFVEALASANKDNAWLFALVGETHFGRLLQLLYELAHCFNLIPRKLGS